jgi:putative OPT family oligopeptide transporter
MPLLRDESVAEFTARAVVTGILLGVIFGAANAYLGLRVGLTVSASIPAAVMTVALFRLFRRNATILEANLSQTVGSASTSLASGTIFTIPDSWWEPRRRSSSSGNCWEPPSPAGWWRGPS